MTQHNGDFIQISDLHKRYREGTTELAVLAGAELSIDRGECLALLGRSGSGKSTLLNLLAGIDRPDKGEIRVAGRELHRMPELDRTLFRRRSVGFVYQFFNLIPTLTVIENVRLPLELNRRSEGSIRSRVEHLLDALGLARRGNTYPDRLSGGEQQRVAIARALAHEPDLLLADEPTGNLDAATGRQVLDLLLEVSRDAGHTLILVTHSLEVARAADRHLLLEEGRLIEDGERLAW